MKTLFMAFAALILLCGCNPQPVAKAGIPKWEYVTSYPTSTELTKDLNGAGQHGWELVSAMPGGNGGGYILIFKRPDGTMPE